MMGKTWSGRLAAALLLGSATAAPVSAMDGTRAESPQRRETMTDVQVWSGGVGQEAQEEMRRAAATYNLHVLFATRQGAYLAGIAYSISDQRGKQLAAGTSEGPWLYAKLPPGRYQITAEVNGMRQSRDIQVASGHRPVRVDFRFAD